MSIAINHQEPSSEEIVRDLGTEPIPAYPYYHPDYFELEKAAIFRRTWLQIAHICELPEPGSFIVREIEIASASILITRGPDDVVRAFHNVCTHRGSQLVREGSGNRFAFTCAYHMWNFGHDGKLRAAPDFDRFYVDKSKCNLVRVSVDTCGGLIFVNLDPSPRQTLREFLGGVADELEALPMARATCFSEYVYEMEGNWKLIVDNFQENYHLRVVHARSAGGSGTGPENPFGYPVAFGFNGPHRRQTIWTNPAVKPAPVQGVGFAKMVECAAGDGLLDGPVNKDYFGIFPNLFVFSQPIMPQSHCIMPLSPDRSRGVVRLYWIGEDTNASRRFAREYAFASIREVHAEDRISIEANQRGLRSGALQHIHFQSQEVLCRHFYHAVQSAIDDFKSSTGARSPSAQ
jgi:phenylpropionate dioxygenase-like ring-hydroxylating dioxygenase large terminal subunit